MRIVGFVPAPVHVTATPPAKSSQPVPMRMSTWSSKVGTQSEPAPELPQLTVKKFASPGPARNVIVLPEAEIDHRWSGQVALTLDGLPHLHEPALEMIRVGWGEVRSLDVAVAELAALARG